jgi:hypothetical protein
MILTNIYTLIVISRYKHFKLTIFINSLTVLNLVCLIPEAKQ